MEGIENAKQKVKTVYIAKYILNTLAGYFLTLSLIRLWEHDGGWFNDFVVFIFLVCVVAVLFAYKRLSHPASKSANPDSQH